MKHIKILGIAVCVIFILLPFSNRAFFIDDWFYFSLSQDITEHLLRPYGLSADEITWPISPPVLLYILGIFIKIFGTDLHKIRIAFIIFPVISALCMYLISCRFTSSPVFATLLLIFTPAFLVTSTGLFPDAVLLSFFLAAILTFLIGCETQKTLWFFLSGILSALACLTKYTGLLIFPILLSYILIERKKIAHQNYIVYLAVSGLIFLSWCSLNVLTYGRIHFIETLKSGHIASTNVLNKLIVQSSFFSGSLIFPVFSFYFVFKQKEKVFCCIMLMLAVLFFCVLYSKFGGYNFPQSLMITIFVFATIIFFYQSIKIYLMKKNGLFLLFWLSFMFIVMIGILEWSASRYFLIFLPPACLIFTKMTENLKFNVFRPVAVLTVLISGLSIQYSDYLQANVNRQVAEDISVQNYPKTKNVSFYFNGDSSVGLYYYMTKLNWKPLYTAAEQLHTGDLILLHQFSLPVILPFADDKIFNRLKPVKIYEYNSNFPIRLMNKNESAGFYNSFWGTLPFVFSKSPLERFHLFRYE